MTFRNGHKLGRYEILGKLASGGMAELFLARSVGAAGFEKLLLLKVLKPDLARKKKFTDMLADEARIAARLDHECVVRTFDFDEADGFRFLVMEYVQGVDLAQILDWTEERELLVPVRFAAYIAMQVARGLAYAHTYRDRGRHMAIVHRDINPHNVIVSRAGEVKILDFGIAKARSRISKTEMGELKGKILYMAPEQARGKEVDARTDIYALGMVLYELVTGIPILSGESDLEILERARAPEQVFLSGDLDFIDDELAVLIRRCLEASPSKRFESADALEDGLFAYLQDKCGPLRPKDLAAWVEPIWRQVAPGRDLERYTAVLDVDSGASSRARKRQTTPLPDPIPPDAAEEDRGLSVPRRRAWMTGVVLAFLIVALAAGFLGVRHFRQRPSVAGDEPGSPWGLPEVVPAGAAVVQATPPGALVFADGRFAGRSPTVVDAPDRNVAVTAALQGRREWNGRANAARERARFLTPALFPGYGAILLPEQGEWDVTVDGRPASVGNGRIAVRAGLRRIEVKPAGSEQGRVWLVRLAPGQVRALDLRE